MKQKPKDLYAAFDIFKKEFNVLEESKKILREENIPKEDLLDKFWSLRKEYEKLLKTIVKVTGVSDRSQKKMLDDNEETEINMEMELKNTLREINGLISSLKDEKEI